MLYRENVMKILVVYSHNDIINWDMNKFNEKSDETHYTKTDSSGNSNFLKFYKNKITTELLLGKRNGTWKSKW